LNAELEVTLTGSNEAIEWNLRKKETGLFSMMLKYIKVEFTLAKDLKDPRDNSKLHQQ